MTPPRHHNANPIMADAATQVEDVVVIKTNLQVPTAGTRRRPASAGACLGGVRRPTSARAGSSAALKMWAKTSHEKTQKEKQESVRLFNSELEETLTDIKLEGQARREDVESRRRSRRHSFTGESWKVGGACAGTVRPSTLSRTHGGTTSGLFSDVQPLEGSESAAALQERLEEKSDFHAGKKRRELAESLRRSRAHFETGAPWRSGGACAGTVRTASLSRTRGSTNSGLFSDVQPLAGSESEALRLEQRMLKQHRRNSLRGIASTESSRTLDRSSSVPSLVLPRKSTSSEAPKAAEENCDFTGIAAELGLFDDAELSGGTSMMQNSKRPAGSATAIVRSARRRSSFGGA